MLLTRIPPKKSNLFGDGSARLLDPKLSGDSVQESRGLQTQRAS